MKQRISWIDIFKGLAIIAIVVGHSGSPIKIHHFVYSFHIAAFLFISGYTFNAQKGLYALLADRTKRLLVPYFSYNLFFFILYAVLSWFNVDSLFYGNKATDFYSLIQLVLWAPLAGMGWFLWTLFETTMCSAILIKVLQRFRLSYLALFPLAIALFFIGVKFTFQLYHPSILLYPPADINLTTVPYFLLGFMARQYKIFDRKQLFLYSTPALLLAMYYLAWQNNANVGFIIRDLKQWPYAVPASLVAIGCLFSISFMAEKVEWLRKPLVLIGENTLPIMCLHVLSFKVFSLLLYSTGLCPWAFVSSYPPPITEYFWLALTSASLGICLAASIVIERGHWSSFLLLGSSSASLTGMKEAGVLLPLILALYACIFIYGGNKGIFDYTRLKVMASGPVQGKYADEIYHIYELIEQEPQKAGLYGELGDGYFQRGEYDRAANQYRIVLAIEPRSIATMSRLVLVYSVQRKPKEALAVLQDMRRVEPDNPDIYYNIACIYARQNKTEKSVEWLKLAVDKGFRNWELIRKDPDIRTIRNMPYINELMGNH